MRKSPRGESRGGFSLRRRRGAGPKTSSFPFPSVIPPGLGCHDLVQLAGDDCRKPSSMRPAADALSSLFVSAQRAMWYKDISQFYCMLLTISGQCPFRSARARGEHGNHARLSGSGQSLA
jgi:hypothetical protein